MPARWPWFERHFTLDFPVEKFPDILERLRGTPLRAEALTRGLALEILTQRDGESWSIQENVGHLAVLEPLWIGRIDDIVSGAEVMREADLTNAATSAADLNARAFDELLASVNEARIRFIDRLESLSEAQVAMSSIHPRTKLRMRVVDLCYFTAEHDDYHLARITELSRKFAGKCT